MLMTIQYYRTAIQNQNQNQNQNQSEIIGNSSTVPVPEFQYCPDPVNEFSDLGTEASKPRARISGSGLRSFSAQVDSELTAS